MAGCPSCGGSARDSCGGGGGGGKGRYQKTGVPLVRVVNVLWLLTSKAEDSSGEIEAILVTAEVNVGREPAKGQNLSRSGDLRDGEGY